MPLALLPLYHRKRQESFAFQKEIVRCERALKGYLTLLRHSLKKALAQYVLDLAEEAKHATVDWWKKLAPLRINSPGRKIQQYLRPIPEIMDASEQSLPMPQAPVGDVFSRTQIEEALRQTKPGSGPGPDGVSIDLLRLANTGSAVQLSILYLKTTLHIATPIQYRGGTLFELYKGKGHHWDMTKYRSLCWQTLLAKCELAPGEEPAPTT